MNLKKTIYIVTHGSYSDYGISAVFDDESLAEQFVNGDKYYGVEEFELNPSELELRTGIRTFYVRMNRNGDTIHVSPEGFRKAEETVIFRDYTHESFMNTYTYARDEQHAVKIANERRAQLIASGEWDSSLDKK